MLAPVLEEVQAEMKNIKIVKLDIDKNPEAADDYNVKNIPTIKVFKDGKLLDTSIGFKSKDALIKMIEQVI